MPIADLSAFKTIMQTGIAEPMICTVVGFTAGRTNSFYRTAIAPGQTAIPAIPTTAVALNNTDAGALNRLIPSQSPKNVYATGMYTGHTGAEMMYYVIDRLSHMGGLSGIVTTAQTVNTAALTRHTSGVGVYAALEIYTAVGATQTTVTMTYTNSGGVGSRVSPAMLFGTGSYGTGTGSTNRFIILPLQDGDKGVQSVQSVTVAATTGTIGNFGVTLFKVLGVTKGKLEIDAPINILSGGATNIPQIDDTACLQLLGIASTSAISVGNFGSIQWGTD